MTGHAEPQNPIPLVDLAPQIADLRDALMRAVAGVLDRGSFVQGEELHRFEESFARYCGVARAIGCASGTDAIHLTLRGLGIGPGDEVIIPAMTFVATAAGVTLAGATPVLADVDPSTVLLDPEAVRAAITLRTRAVIPVHLYGQCVPMAPLLDIAKSRGIFVVEDAAQAHGAEQDGCRAGSFAHAACFSFYPSKNLGAYGDGGIVTTPDGNLAERIRLLGNWGSRRKYHHEEEGINSRLDTLQAALLHVKLPRLDGWNALRRAHAARYDELLAEVPEIQPVSCAPGSVYHLYVVRVSGRDEILAGLHEAGIGAAMHYPFAIHELTAYRQLRRDGGCPTAEAWARGNISLPMYPEMPDEAPDRVVAALKSLVTRR